MHRTRLDRALVSLSSLAVSVPALAVVAPEPVTVADLLRIDGDGIAHRLTMTSTELGPERWQLALDYSSTPPLAATSETATMAVQRDGSLMTVSLTDGLHSWSMTFDGANPAADTWNASLSSTASDTADVAHGQREVARLMRRAFDTRLGGYAKRLSSFVGPNALDLARAGGNGGGDPRGPMLHDCSGACDECRHQMWEHGFALVGLVGVCGVATPLSAGAGAMVCLSAAGMVLVDGDRMADVCDECDGCHHAAPTQPPEVPDIEDPEPEPDVNVQ